MYSSTEKVQQAIIKNKYNSRIRICKIGVISDGGVGIRGWGSITADSLAALSAASLRGMLEWAGIQIRLTLREGRLARVWRIS